MKKLMFSIFVLTCTACAFPMNSEQEAEDILTRADVSLSELNKALEDAEKYDDRISEWCAWATATMLTTWALPLPEPYHPPLIGVGACIMTAFSFKLHSSQKLRLLQERCAHARFYQDLDDTLA